MAWTDDPSYCRCGAWFGHRHPCWPTAEERAAQEARRSEMAAVLEALRRCWTKHHDRTLDDVFAEVKWMDDFDPGDFSAWPDAELLKALEKYTKGGG